MSIREALENTLKMLEELGYTGGDVHDDLSLAISRLKSHAARILDMEL